MPSSRIQPAVFLYLGGNSDYSDILVLGNLVKVIGKLDNYYNLVQIKEIESIELVEKTRHAGSR